MCNLRGAHGGPVRASAVLGLILLLAAPGCSLWHGAAPIPEPIGLVAVLPIERAESISDTPAVEGEPLAPGAERVVTAQIYAVLSSSSEWRFVPDLTAAAALGQIRSAGDIEARALALGKAVNADAVLFGTVSRYVERVGSEYGARRPASVSLTLQLLSTASGKVLWKDSFDQTQRALSSNLFNWWQFWRGGPRWFSAAEFTRLGVEHLLQNLAKQIQFK